MIRKINIAALLAACSFAGFAGEEYPELPRKITDETPAQKSERMAWWQHDRFGMFIHFGLYAVPGRHEWVQSYEYIDPKNYEAKYLKRFNPDLYDAKEWARIAKQAGMKYAVLTTKHHEGFCMWDQIDELLTQYGKIDIVWFDYTVKHKFGKTYKHWDAVNLVKHIRKLQPGLVIDNRLDLMDTDDGWDFVTPEQFKASSWPVRLNSSTRGWDTAGPGTPWTEDVDKRRRVASLCNMWFFGR